jgi:hypothetical protein
MPARGMMKNDPAMEDWVFFFVPLCFSIIEFMTFYPMDIPYK